MASLNKVTLIGNLGQDPELRYMPDGTPVASLSIATTEKFKDKNGESKENTSWHRVLFFSRQAEVCRDYLKKGSSVYIEGALRYRKYQDKETGADCYVTEIRASKLVMLSTKSTDGASQDQAHNGETPTPPVRKDATFTADSDVDVDLEEDIPF